jgi:peptidoglycan/LPS O-acetylase OafA/YrhL
MAAAVTLLVALVGIAVPHVARLDAFATQSPPDLAALFALGMVAAGIVAAGERRRSWPWAWFALAAAAPVLATIWWQGSVWTLDSLLWVDIALGPAIACLLAALVTGRPAMLVRLLDTRPLRSLGLSSYSLYLTHGPIVVVLYEKVVAGRVGHGGPSFLLALAVVVPATVLFARAFAAVFEIPFQRHRGWPPALRVAVRAVSRRRRGESGRPAPTYSQGAAS